MELVHNAIRRVNATARVLVVMPSMQPGTTKEQLGKQHTVHPHEWNSAQSKMHLHLAFMPCNQQCAKPCHRQNYKSQLV